MPISILDLAGLFSPNVKRVVVCLPLSAAALPTLIRLQLLGARHALVEKGADDSVTRQQLVVSARWRLVVSAQLL